ncbi:MAG: RNHCP domain-containing protein [Patescibacteria group bacterium]|mgnify:CR=1 FL=1
MDTPKFQRKIEDFVCERCGTRVEGNGYTNHCPKCLWSKHVDVNPGDRSAVCKGLMKPVGVEEKSGKYNIVYHCRVCAKTIKNKVAPEDDMEMIARLGGKATK